MLRFDSSLTESISVQVVEMAVIQCPLGGAPLQLPNSGVCPHRKLQAWESEPSVHGEPVKISSQD